MITIKGELNQDNAAKFELQMNELNYEPGKQLVLDMSAFDVEDGIGLATTINALRQLLERVSKLKIIRAPQMLGHNLYRLGMLDENHRIELIDMRIEEPYG